MHYPTFCFAVRMICFILEIFFLVVALAWPSKFSFKLLEAILATGFVAWLCALP